MRYLFIIWFFLLSFIGISQDRSIILNDNGNVILSGAINLYVNQSNPNGIVKTGFGIGGILMDDERARLFWKVGTTVNTYNIPIKTTEGEQIPIIINKASAGTLSSNGEFVISTYHTPSNNTPYPMNSDTWFSDVTNTNGSTGLDNSINAADRFWVIIFNGYSTKPTIVLTLSYDATGVVTDIGGLTENNLQAQYWDGTKWVCPPVGTVDVVNHNVNTINNVNFDAPWVVVNKNDHLPITLIRFKANCHNGKTTLIW